MGLIIMALNESGLKFVAVQEREARRMTNQF